MTTKTNNVLRTDYLQCFEHPDITELYSTPRDFRKLFPDCVEQQTHMKTLKEEFFSFLMKTPWPRKNNLSDTEGVDDELSVIRSVFSGTG